MKHLLQRRWTLTIAFLAILAISGCGGQKSDNSATTSPGGESTPQSTATTGSAPSGGTSSSNSGNSGTATSKGTLTAEAQQLGVKPQGATACPKNAPVKGVATAKRGNIYQTAKSPDYKNVKPIICFTDVATAEKAGFSAPK